MRIRRSLFCVLIVLLSTLLIPAAAPAALSAARAAAVTELTARWNPPPPASVPSGTLVTGEFRLNLNDPDSGADGVRENVVVEIALTHGQFRSVPGLCRTAGVTPASAILDDGVTLRCNLGSVRHGTARVVEFGAMARGEDGEALRAVVRTAGTTEVALAPVPITGVRGVEVTFDVNYGGDSTLEVVHPVFPFGVAVPVGGAALRGPVQFDVVIADGAGASARDLLIVDGSGCTDHEVYIGASIPRTSAQSPLPSTCTITRTAPGRFHVVLDGLKAEPWVDAPRTSAAQSPLPTDRDFFAAGVLTLRTTVPPGDAAPGGSFTFTATVENVRAQTASGVALTEDWQPDNNTETRLFSTPGGGQIWLRYNESDSLFQGQQNAIAGQGASWDASALAAAGGTVLGTIKNWGFEDVPAAQLPAGQRQSVCSAVDSAAPTTLTGRIAIDTGTVDPRSIVVDVLTTPVAGAGFDCAVGGWQRASIRALGAATGSAVAGTVYAVDSPGAGITAVRVSVDPADLRDGETKGGALRLWTVWHVDDDATEGTDVWILGSGSTPSGGQLHHTDPPAKVATPGARYPSTNYLRDVLYVTRWVPFVDKTVSTPNPDLGDTVHYAIRSGLRNPAYARDTGGYTVTDVLPAGLRYVAASADPAPASVTPGPRGTTRLIWGYRDVPVNVDQRIRYDAVVELGGGTAVNTARIDTTDRPGYVPTYANGGLDDASIAVVRAGRTVLTKDSSQSVFALDAPDRWLLTLHNDDQVVQEVTDVIDVLPFVGDGRGSAFSGGFTLGSVDVSQGEQVLYTAVDPSRLSPDPEDPANGALGAPSTIWSPTRPSGRITGIRIVGHGLGVGATATTAITWTPENARPGDKYVNYAWAKTTHTELRMVRAASASVVAEPSTLQVDKTTTATEAEPGTPVSYLITARNAGPRPARGVVVTDRPGFGLDAASLRVEPPGKGTWDAATRTWAIGDLAVGEEQTLRITVGVARDYDRDRAVVNRVLISSPHQPLPTGPGCVANDTVEADTDQCDVVAVAPATTRLALNKKAIRVSPAGDSRTGTVDWLLEVRNNGLRSASAVVVSEGLPAGATADGTRVLGRPSRGVWVTAAEVWRIGDLPVGAVATMRLRTTHPLADLRAGVVNEAIVSGSEAPYRGGRRPNPDLDGDTDQYDRDRATLPPLVAGPVLPATGGPSRLALVGGLGSLLVGLLLLGRLLLGRLLLGRLLLGRPRLRTGSSRGLSQPARRRSA